MRAAATLTSHAETPPNDVAGDRWRRAGPRLHRGVASAHADADSHTYATHHADADRAQPDAHEWGSDTSSNARSSGQTSGVS